MEKVMRRSLCCSMTLAVCTLSTAEAAMHRSSPPDHTSGAIVDDAHPTRPSAALAGKSVQHVDSPGEAQGRRILSTAFVRIGSDGYLTIELRDGRTLVLRGVTMRAADYCGERASGGKPYCGRYAEVAAARPGGGPMPRDYAAELDPVVR